MTENNSTDFREAGSSTNQLQFKIKKRQLDILVGRLSASNLAGIILVFIFSYYYWDSAPQSLLFSWMVFHLVITILKSVYVYPRYQKADINEENLGYWQNWFTFTLLVSGVAWGVAMAWFIVPNDVVLMLVLIFTFFVILLTATLMLSCYMPVYYAMIIPVISGLCVTFFKQQDLVQIEGIVAFFVFILINFRFSKMEHDDMKNLIILQFEKEELAQKLAMSVEEKNRFLAAASHDLRQPLHASGLLLSALKGHVSSQDGKQLLGDISLSMNALSDSFSSLLDMSKLDAAVVETDIAHLSLGAVVANVCKEFTLQAEKKDITIKFSGPEIAVKTDLVQLDRIIRNLVSNAVNYTETGSITIGWNSKGSEATFSIEDTGIGILEKNLDMIFSEYYQIDNPERDRNKGFGLGLAIVKRLCDLLNLQIRVTSQIGVGTQIQLILPVGDIEKVVDDSTIEVESNNLSGLKLLVIDDDISVLNSMNKLLESWGCEVFCAEGEREAIQVLSEHNAMPDMILADYRLRGNKTGVQACERICDEFNCQIPVVIITGDTLPERLQQIVSSGYQLLHKPVSAAQLRAFIQHQLMNLA